MNKRQIPLSITVLSMTVILSAQVNYQSHHYYYDLSIQTIEPMLVEIIDGISTMHYSMSSATINGSPYLSEEFMEGALTIADGTTISGLKFRYDIYSDEMQFLINQDTASITRPLALRSVELGDRKFIYEVYQVSDRMVAAGYFELIEEGEILTILFRREIELEIDSYVSNYGGGGGTKEFKMKENNNYYVKQGKSAAQKIYRKKDFLDIITDHHDQVKQYMKDHKISVRKADDLQAVASYYNSLYAAGS